jgi:PucR family transcriptional regulator, proline-responsive transcriptional activator
MELTICEIGERMVKYKPKLRIVSNQVVRSCCMFHPDLKTFDPYCVYIGRASALPDNVFITSCVNLVLITNKRTPSKLLSNNLVNLIIIQEKNGDIPTINELQSMFTANQYITIATSKLLPALSEGWSLQQILDLGYELLGNPVLLVDASTSFLAYSGNIDLSDEPAWQSHINSGYITSEYYDLYMKEIRLAYENKGRSDPLLLESNFWRHRILLNKVVYNNKPLAFLEVLEYNTIFKEHDSKLIELISHALSIEIHRKSFTSCIPESTTEAFIVNLLLNNQANNAVSITLAKQLHINLNGNLFIMCVDPRNIPEADAKIYHVKNILQRTLACNYAVTFQGYVVLLISKKKPQLELEEISLINNILIKNKLIAGMSRCFHSLKDIPLNYQQAVTAIKMGSRIRQGNQLYMYEDYMPYHMIDVCSKKVDLMNMCIPGLIELISYDQKKKTQYALSLYHFIQNNLDMQKTSDVLHIHYNTLKYRLQKIEDMYGIDLSSRSLQLSLRLSFIMFEYTYQMDFEEYWNSCIVKQCD